MFDDLVCKDNNTQQSNGNIPTGQKSPEDVLQNIYKEFVASLDKHMRNYTSTDSYCSELEDILLRNFVEAGYITSSSNTSKP